MKILLKDIIDQLPGLEKSIELELTNICNAACCMCPREEITRPMGRMSRETIEQTVRRCEEYGINEISIGGMGEPLLHPDFFEYIDLISEINGVEISLTTNALLLTGKIRQKVVNSNISEISISFHGATAESYEKILKVKHNRAVENIESMIKNYPGYTKKIKIAIVKNKMNAGEVDDIMRFWGDRGIEDFIVLKAHNRAGYLKDKQIVDEDFYKSQSIPINSAHKSYCKTPSFVLKFIDWEGKIHICCNDYKSRGIMGDVFNSSFLEIEEKREAIWNSIQHTFCKECNMPSTLLYTEVINGQPVKR